MPRPKIIVGNWKMYTTRTGSVELAKAVVQGNPAGPNTKVVVCPPFPWLTAVAQAIAGSHVELGAQDCGVKKTEGAFTGQVSPDMLVEAGCRYTLVGHSERRHDLGESATLLREKATAGLDAGLTVIFCVGETLPQRQADQTEATLAEQLQNLVGLDPSKFDRLVVAYEPKWAIGTGHAATPEQVQTAHAFIRKQYAQLPGCSAVMASVLPILYGGTVNPENAAGLLALADVDGALVGGASLKADKFHAIVKAAG